jgi:hypothetical protein
MTILVENLQSEVLNRNVKISILSCFGDIGLAIGPAFEPYLNTTMSVLSQAGQVEPNPVSHLHPVSPGHSFYVFSLIMIWLITLDNCVRAFSRHTLELSLALRKRHKVMSMSFLFPSRDG